MSDMVDDSVKPDPGRCLECGAALTDEEQQAALESGTAPLCAVHAAEDEPALETGEAEPGPA